jgi:hypothetical protein
MEFRFSGGGCAGSSNSQPNPAFFRCEDIGAGPPTETGERAFITAASVNDEVEYFSGVVSVGDSFAFSGSFDDNMKITVFTENNLEELQTVILHTSCAIELSLKDQFGSVQLLEFINQSQGTVSSFLNATLMFEIDGPEEGREALLSSLVVAINTDTVSNTGGGLMDLSDQVSGVTVTADTPFQTNTTLVLDLTEKTVYTALSTVTGTTAVGLVCQGADDLEFTAGNPLSPSSPTISPSIAPTGTLFPTPDPETTPCNVTASITCRTTDFEECDFTSPVGKTCIGSPATELRFIYLSEGRCRGNNTQSSFECTDENTSVALPFTVWIRIFLGGATFYDGIVNEGNIFTVPVLGNANSIEIEISTVNGSVDGPGIILQASTLSIRCQDDDGITLFNTFGSLQLVGYRNAEQGLETVFANILIRYIASNTGRLDALLTGAFKTTPFFSGMEPLLAQGDQILLMPTESTSFSDTFTLNLGAAAGQNLQFGFLVQGEGARSRAECSNSDSLSIVVET